MLKKKKCKPSNEAGAKLRRLSNFVPLVSTVNEASAPAQLAALIQLK